MWLATCFSSFETSSTTDILHAFFPVQQIQEGKMDCCNPVIVNWENFSSLTSKSRVTIVLVRVSL